MVRLKADATLVRVSMVRLKADATLCRVRLQPDHSGPLKREHTATNCAGSSPATRRGLPSPNPVLRVIGESAGRCSRSARRSTSRRRRSASRISSRRRAQGAVETALPDKGHNLVQFAGIEERAVAPADIDDSARDTAEVDTVHHPAAFDARPIAHRGRGWSRVARFRTIQQRRLRVLLGAQALEGIGSDPHAVARAALEHCQRSKYSIACRLLLARWTRLRRAAPCRPDAPRPAFINETRAPAKPRVKQDGQTDRGEPGATVRAAASLPIPGRAAIGAMEPPGVNRHRIAFRIAREGFVLHSAFRQSAFSIARITTMGLMDFIKGELIDVIEWTDDSRDTLSYRFPDEDKAIKNGAQLIVRESQQVQFVYLGEFGDTFGPGKHTLTTDNIPVLTKLKSWKYGFNSPFKADVYYVNTRLFTGNKWGTANPIMMRDDDLGIVRVRAFGTYDFRIIDPKLFLKEVAGSDHNFRLDEFADTMRSRIVSVFADALASAQVPVFDVASRYTRARRGAAAADQPGRRRQVRPRDRQLRRRERLGAAGGRAGDRQAVEHGRGRQPERLRQVPDGAGHGEGRRLRRHGDRAGGGPVDRAADHAAAGHAAAAAAARRRRRPAGGRCRDLLVAGRCRARRSASPRPT